MHIWTYWPNQSLWKDPSIGRLSYAVYCYAPIQWPFRNWPRRDRGLGAAHAFSALALVDQANICDVCRWPSVCPCNAHPIVPLSIPIDPILAAQRGQVSSLFLCLPFGIPFQAPFGPPPMPSKQGQICKFLSVFLLEFPSGISLCPTPPDGLRFLSFFSVVLLEFLSGTSRNRSRNLRGIVSAKFRPNLIPWCRVTAKKPRGGMFLVRLTRVCRWRLWKKLFASVSMKHPFQNMYWRITCFDRFL